MTYNWQIDDRSSFRHWIIPEVLAHEEVEPIAAATDQFTNIEFGFTINGIPVDADRFLDRLQKSMHHEATLEAARIIEQNERLTAVYETLETITNAAKSAIEDAVAGTTLEPYVDRGW